MRYILDAIYALLLLCVSPFLIYASVRFGKYRDGLGQKLLGLVPSLDRTKSKQVWCHAVSVGEVNLLATLIPKLIESEPDLKIVITTTTKTGYGLAIKRFPDHVVSYCPLDFSWAISRAFSRFQPDLIVLVELELWPNLLMHAKRTGVPVAIVNGRLSENSFRGYRRIKPIVERCLASVALVAAQSEEYAERFENLGAKHVHCTGSMKFDGASTDRGNQLSLRLRELIDLGDDDLVFVAGSTQSPEEEVVLRVYSELRNDFPELRLILVPRHPERAADVEKLFCEFGLQCTRRSALALGETLPRDRVLLVDVVGELGGWWGCADIGFVGGSLGSRGGQNMLEPSGFGVATCFGPNTRNFRDVVELLLSNKAARVVRDGDDLTHFVRDCAEDTDFRKTLGTRAQMVVVEQRGATEETVALIRKLIIDRGSTLSHDESALNNSTVLHYPNAESKTIRRSA